MSRPDDSLRRLGYTLCMRFMDEIRTMRRHAGDDVCESLLNIPVVTADGVASFVFAQAKYGRSLEDVVMGPVGTPHLAAEFPNIIPPFGSFWIEWKNDLAFDDEDLTPIRGCLVQGSKCDTDLTIKMLLLCQRGDRSTGVQMAAPLILTSDRSGIITTQSFADPEPPWQPIPDCVACESGDCIAHLSVPNHLSNPAWRFGDPLTRYTDRFAWAYALYRIPLMTICFMNCKNVKVNWLPPPDPAYVKSFAKKHDGKRPSAHVGTINITPMTNLISAAVDANKDPENPHAKSRRTFAADTSKPTPQTIRSSGASWARIGGTLQRAGSNRQTPKNQNRKSTPSTLKASL